MAEDVVLLNKLMILYLLNRVKFPMTQSQVSNFMLEKDYMSYMNFQSAMADLIEDEMIYAETFRNRTHLSITKEGEECLAFFEKRISDPIKEDVDQYVRENEMQMKDEVSVLSHYYKSVSGEYEADLIAREKDAILLEIKIATPDAETASAVCARWQESNQEIYQMLAMKLFG